MEGEKLGTTHLQGNQIFIKIPKFHGYNDPDVYLEWEAKVSQIFSINTLEDKKQLDLVVVEFEGYAKT